MIKFLLGFSQVSDCPGGKADPLGKTRTPEWDAPKQDAQGLCGTVNLPEPSLPCAKWLRAVTHWA